MKNKKAFTLIELLAVIVVLAIIALIATPIVMKTIKNAKKGAAERSADSYIKQVEVAVATSKLDGKDVQDGTYEIVAGNLKGEGLPDGELKIEVSGNKPESGTVTITNGQVTSTSEMEIGDYKVSYDKENNKYETTEKGSTPSSTVVYRMSEDGIKTGDTLDLNDTSKFTKDASTLGKSYYLKHVLDKDNKVTKTYACVIFGGKEYCLTNGEYGWANDEVDYTGNVLILKKIDNASIEGISCKFGDDNSWCRNDSVTLVAYPFSDVASMNSDGFTCYIDDDENGDSLCGDF